MTDIKNDQTTTITTNTDTDLELSGSLPGRELFVAENLQPTVILGTGGTTFSFEPTEPLATSTPPSPVNEITYSVSLEGAGHSITVGETVFSTSTPVEIGRNGEFPGESVATATQEPSPFSSEFGSIVRAQTVPV